MKRHRGQQAVVPKSRLVKSRGQELLDGQFGASSVEIAVAVKAPHAEVVEAIGRIRWSTLPPEFIAKYVDAVADSGCHADGVFVLSERATDYVIHFFFSKRSPFRSQGLTPLEWVRRKQSEKKHSRSLAVTPYELSILGPEPGLTSNDVGRAMQMPNETIVKMVARVDWGRLPGAHVAVLKTRETGNGVEIESYAMNQRAVKHLERNFVALSSYRRCS